MIEVGPVKVLGPNNCTSPAPALIRPLRAVLSEMALVNCTEVLPTVLPTAEVSVRVPPLKTVGPEKVRDFSVATVGKVVLAAMTNGLEIIRAAAEDERICIPFRVRVPPKPKALSLDWRNKVPAPLSVVGPV